MHAPGLFLASGVLLGTVTIAVSRLNGRLYRFLHPRLDRLAPEDRARVITFLALLPWLAATTTLMLAFLPSVLTVPGLIEDHCLPHDHHPHLCLAHGRWLPSGSLWGSVALLGAVATFLWMRLVLRVFRAHRMVLTLLRVSRKQGAIQVLPTPRPMAFTAGLLRPRTVVSDAVLANLPAEDLDIVISHEEGHAHRRDALWRFVLEALTLGMPRSSRTLLLEDFSLAGEEVCDRRTIRGQVTPDRVAEVLLRMQRLGCLQPEGVAGATGSHLARRVKALLGDPYPPRPRWMKAVWLAPLLLLAADPVHHLAETLLGQLLF